MLALEFVTLPKTGNVQLIREHYLVGVPAVLVPGLEFEPALSVLQMKEVTSV